MITSGSASYRIHTYSAEDFPHLPDLDAVALQEVDRELLLGTIARVSRSASRDESRPVLTGIFVELRGGQARDGRDRLLPARGQGDRRARAAPRPRGDHPGPGAPGARADRRLGRRRSSSRVQENHVVFGADGIWLTTRRIDGQFPNYRQLLPEQFEHELELPRDELLDVVRRVGLLAQRNSPLRLRFAEGELTVSARTQDVGEAQESLPAPFAADAARDRLQRRVPARRPRVDRLADRALQADQPAPARRCCRARAPDYTYLIMPIRLAG